MFLMNEVDDKFVVSDRIDVPETKHVVSDFLLQDQYLNDRFFGVDGQNADIALRNILVRFDEYVFKLGLEDAAFFRLDIAKRDFVERFKYFASDIDRRIGGLEDDLTMYEGVHDFPNNWRFLVREVCYYCFFVHYGAKRRDQKDLYGRPQDYVYHVIRTAFNKLIKVVEFPKFKFFLTALMHDTKEDFYKGFPAVLSADEDSVQAFCDTDGVSSCPKGMFMAKGRKSEIIDEMESFESDIDDQISFNPLDELDLTECIDIITKGGNNRDIAFLEILAKVLKYDGSKLIDAICVLLVKIVDRLENTESDVSEKNKNQTRFAYLPLCVDMGMWGVLDAFYDLLYLVDYEFRVKWKNLLDISDVDEGGEVPVTQKFFGEFARQLNQVPGFESAVYGKDYVLKLRPVGIRYASYDDALKMTANGEYTKALRSYLIFYPIDKNPKMVEAAINIFKLLFPRHLTGDLSKHFQRPEVSNLFGRVALANRGGVELDQHGYSDKYGVGIWGVYDSRRGATRRLGGDPHLAVFYEGGDVNFAKDRMIGVLKKIKPDVHRLLEQYRIFSEATNDGIGGVQNLIDGISANILTVTDGSSLNVSDNTSDHLPDNLVNIFWPDQFITMIGRLVMAIFMKKGRNIDVVINDRKHQIALPNGVNDEDAIVWAEPLMVGMEFSLMTNQRTLVFNVSDKYNNVLADRQNSDLHVLLNGYRDNLLRDDMVKGRSEKLTGHRGPTNPRKH